MQQRPFPRRPHRHPQRRTHRHSERRATTTSAAETLFDFARNIEPRLAPAAALGGIAEWAAKLVGATVRLAALLHLADDPASGWQRPVDGDRMRSAVKLASYFTADALAAYDLMGADPALADARVVLEHLRHRKIESFTVRDLMVSLPCRRFPKVGTVTAAVAMLAEHGWVRPQPEQERTGPGRPPSPRYDVHPQTYATESTQYTEPRPTAHSVDSVDSVVKSAGFRHPVDLAAAVFGVVRDAAGKPLTVGQIASKAGVTGGAVETFLAPYVADHTVIRGMSGKHRTYAWAVPEATS
jgi:hypothetical protein